MPQKKMNESDLLDRAKELNVGLVQVADNMPLHEMSDEQIERFCQKADALGISLEAGANNMTPENLQRYITVAGKINSRILRFSIDGKDYKHGVEDVIGIIKNAQSELKKRDIILALENHDRLYTHDFCDIMEAVGNSHVGICLDSANSLGLGEGFHEVARELARYTVNFHLKEVHIRKYHMMGFDVEGRPFGEGCLPAQWMLEQLPSKCETAILEQWTPPEADIHNTIAKQRDWARRSILYLKKYFE
jgi:sugar phosphate isomerase/epimerase